MGILRSQSAMHTQQRRAFKTMPQQFTVKWTMEIKDLKQWQAWMLNNGINWFRVDLVSMYSGLQNSVPLAAHMARLISGLSIAPAGGNYVDVVAQLELSPTMYKGALR